MSAACRLPFWLDLTRWCVCIACWNPVGTQRNHLMFLELRRDRERLTLAFFRMFSLCRLSYPLFRPNRSCPAANIAPSVEMLCQLWYEKKLDNWFILLWSSSTVVAWECTRYVSSLALTHYQGPTKSMSMKTPSLKSYR